MPEVLRRFATYSASFQTPSIPVCRPGVARLVPVCSGVPNAKVRVGGPSDAVRRYLYRGRLALEPRARGPRHEDMLSRAHYKRASGSQTSFFAFGVPSQPQPLDDLCPVVTRQYFYCIYGPAATQKSAGRRTPHRVWPEFGGNPCPAETPTMFLFVQQCKTENGPPPRFSLLASGQRLTAISERGAIHFFGKVHATRRVIGGGV